MARSYENFDIEVVHDHDGYGVRVRSPRGEARADFHMPLTPQEIRILGLTVARGRGTSRSVQTRDVTADGGAADIPVRRYPQP